MCRPGVHPRVAAHACFTADDGAEGQGLGVAAQRLPLPGATRSPVLGRCVVGEGT